MIQYKKLMMTLALLLTAVGGAWATDPKVYTEPVAISSLHVGDILATGFSLTPASNLDVIYFDANRFKQDDSPMGSQWGVSLSYIKSYGENAAMTFTTPSDPPSDLTATPVDASGNDGNAWVVTLVGNTQGTYTIRLSGTYYDPPIEVKPVEGKTNEWTFSMPGSDVVLTPIYSAATIYDADDAEKQAYETLKEAFANVQDGDVIKLDWDVTLTEHLATPTIDGGVKFTLDFNGYTIDGGTTYYIVLNNAGDQLTFTDSSDDQLGGLIAKDLVPVAGSDFVFVAGRYNFSGATAETINGVCADSSFPLSLAEGKEFVDLEGAPDADGFMVRVAYKDFELTIGAGKFATFYMDQNITLADGTDANIGLYTIIGEGIDLDNNTVTVTKVNDPIAFARMPLLVYNGTTEQKTVSLKVTPVAPTASQMWSSHFKGTAVDKTFDADDMAANDYFALSGGKAFAPVKGTGTIGKNKCWLEFAKQQTPGARQLTIVFDSDATGIRSMDNGQLIMDNWYDLNGRKLNAKPTRKGVYIKNGQKVVK